MIYDPCHFSLHPFLPVIPVSPSLNAGVGFEEKAGGWRRTPAVMEMVIFLTQGDDLCSHRNPRPYRIIKMEKIAPSDILWRIFSLVRSLLLPPLLSCFHSTSLRQGSDMLIVKIIFLHPECAELDKDRCAAAASW